MADAGRQPVQAAVMRALVAKLQERVYEAEKKKRKDMGFEHVTARRRPALAQSKGRSLRQQVLVNEAVSILFRLNIDRALLKIEKLTQPVLRGMHRAASLERKRMQYSKYFGVEED